MIRYGLIKKVNGLNIVHNGVGSRGLGSPKASYIGSVAHGIVNNSKLPVLVVK